MKLLAIHCCWLDGLSFFFFFWYKFFKNDFKNLNVFQWFNFPKNKLNKFFIIIFTLNYFLHLISTQWIYEHYMVWKILKIILLSIIDYVKLNNYISRSWKSWLSNILHNNIVPPPHPTQTLITLNWYKTLFFFLFFLEISFWISFFKW